MYVLLFIILSIIIIIYWPVVFYSVMTIINYQAEYDDIDDLLISIYCEGRGSDVPVASEPLLFPNPLIMSDGNYW